MPISEGLLLLWGHDVGPRDSDAVMDGSATDGVPHVDPVGSSKPNPPAYR